MEQETVYVKFDQNNMVHKRKVTLEDVGAIYCAKDDILAKVKDIELLDIPDKKKEIYVISVLRIIKLIQLACPDVNVENLGDTDIIIEYSKERAKKGLLQGLKVFVTCSIVFIGSMYTIMAYNNDVGVNELFSKVYGLFGDGVNTGVIEVCYCIGLTLGICVFYNHFVGKKLSSAPTPVEIQMRSYESDMNEAIVAKAGRFEEEQDV